jgi:hypothetical protein
MANLFTATAGAVTVDPLRAGGSATTGFGANYAVPTTERDDFGTPQLSFLKIAALATATPVDISSAALRAAVVRGVQGFAEMYGMGVTDPSSPYDVIVIVKDSTANGAEASSNVQATTFGAMEAAISAQLVAAGASSVTSTVVTRYGQFTGDIFA